MAIFEALQFALLLRKDSDRYKTIIKSIKDASEDGFDEQTMKLIPKLIPKLTKTDIINDFKNRLASLPNLFELTCSSVEEDSNFFNLEILFGLANEKLLTNKVKIHIEESLNPDNEDFLNDDNINTNFVLMGMLFYQTLGTGHKYFTQSAEKNQIIQYLDEEINIDKLPWSIKEHADLRKIFACLKKFVHSSNKEITLKTRDFCQRMNIPVSLNLMINWSIEGMKISNDEIENLVLVIGFTGSGKSSLINYLYGVKYKYAKHPFTGTRYLCQKPGQGKAPANVGHERKSETLYPQIIDFKTVAGKKYKFSFCDCPGFSDTREGDEALCAALSIPIAVFHSKKIKAVLIVIQHDSTTQNTEGRGATFRLISNTLGNLFHAPLTDLPLLFIISKPPEPLRDESFNTDELRMHVFNRISAIDEDLNDESNIGKIEKIKINFKNSMNKLDERNTCITELNNLLQTSESGQSLLGTISSRIFEASKKGQIEIRVQEQSEKWKHLSNNCITDLSNVLRKVLSQDPNAQHKEIERQRAEWTNEVTMLETSVSKLKIEYEEKIAEKEIVKIIKDKGEKAIFIIRGYEVDDNAANDDLPDDGDKLKERLSEICDDSSSEICRKKFKFDGSHVQFKELSDWVNRSMFNIQEIIKQLLDLPQHINYYDNEIINKTQQITGEKKEIEELLTVDHKHLTPLTHENLIRKKKEKEALENFNSIFAKRLEFLKQNIASIENDSEIDYQSILDVDERSLIGKLFNYTSWSYIYPTGIMWRCIAYLIPRDTDKHVPIERVELSNTVDENKKIVFKTKFEFKRAESSETSKFENSAVVKPGVNLVEFTNPKISIVKADNQNKYTEIGKFEIGKADLNNGIFELSYQTNYKESGYAGVRIFVLPKNLPKFQQIVKINEEKIDKVSKIYEKNNIKIKNVTERIEEDEKFLKLISLGLTNAIRVERIQKILLELDFNKNTFIKTFFNEFAEKSILWIENRANLHSLIRTKETTLKNLKISKDEFHEIVGIDNYDKGNSKHIDDEQHIAPLLDIHYKTGLSFASLHQILSALKDETDVANNNSLLKQLKTSLTARQKSYEDFLKYQKLYKRQSRIISTIRIVNDLKITLNYNNQVEEFLEKCQDVSDDFEEKKIIATDNEIYEKLMLSVLLPIKIQSKNTSEAQLSILPPINYDNHLNILKPYNVQCTHIGEYFLENLLSDDYFIRMLTIQNLESAPDECKLCSKSFLEKTRQDTNLSACLLSRAVKNKTLASCLYWVLKVQILTLKEIQNPTETSKTQLKDIIKKYEDLMSLLKSDKDLEFQEKCLQDIRSLKDNIQNKITVPETFKLTPTSFILDPHFHVHEINCNKTEAFDSKSGPWKFVFNTTEKMEYTAIYKIGDDLRRDQITIQFIFLADKFLKEQNLDLKLTPFKIVSTGVNEGFIDYVDAIPIASLIRQYKSIKGFLAKCNPHAESYARAIDSFIRSSAGYAIINYLLDTRDRHLDNILVKKTGEIVHIDFAYVLGIKTKMYQPAIKLTEDMVDVMGGRKSEKYKEFLKYCCDAFLILRKHRTTLIELFSLMGDSYIEVINDTSINQLRGRFLQDFHESEAKEFITNKINDSYNRGTYSDCMHQFQ